MLYNMNIKKTLITASIVAFSVATGGFLGYFLGSIFNAPRIVGDDYIQPVLDDIEVTRKTFKDIVGSSSISDIDFSSSAVSSKLSAPDIVNIALDTMNSHSKIISYSDGSADADSAIGMVHQVIFSGWIKDSESYFIESIASSSFAKTAVRFYLPNLSEDETTVYKGNDLKSLDYGLRATYTNPLKRSEISSTLDNGTLTTISSEEVITYYGRVINSPCIYQISNDSVIKANEIVEVVDPINGNESANTSIIRNEDKTYNVKLLIEPLKGIINYTAQMGAMNPMVDKPTYKEVLLDFHLSSDLNVISKRVHERYEVYPQQTNGGPSMTYGLSTEYYFYENSTFSIPDKSTDFPYASLKALKE